MAIDLKALDDKIKKLQLIRQIASDPELGALLQDVIVGNGNAAPQVQSPASAPKGVRLEVFKRVPVAGEIGEYRTAKQILERAKAAGYKFLSKDPLLTVKEQLRELEKSGLIEKAGSEADGTAFWRRK